MHKTTPVTKIYLAQNIVNAEAENTALQVAFWYLCKQRPREECPVGVSPKGPLGRSLDLLLWQRLTGTSEYGARRVSLGLAKNRTLIGSNQKALNPRGGQVDVLPSENSLTGQED